MPLTARPAGRQVPGAPVVPYGTSAAGAGSGRPGTAAVTVPTFAAVPGGAVRCRAAGAVDDALPVCAGAGPDGMLVVHATRTRLATLARISDPRRGPRARRPVMISPGPTACWPRPPASGASAWVQDGRPTM